MQPELPKSEKQRKQQERWKTMKEQGPVFYVTRTIIILLCAYEFGWLAWGYIYKRGWSHTPATFSLRDIIVDVVAGLGVGLWEWSEMRRKFEPRDPTKVPTMV
jgi:uncharacterized ion transporter superfamily protein YfcC